MNMKAIGVRRALLVFLAVLLLTCTMAITAAAEETYVLDLNITMYDDLGEEGDVGIKAYLAPGTPIVLDDLIAKYPILAEALTGYVLDADTVVGLPADGLMPAGNLTVNATYKTTPYTVTWVVDGQTVATEQYAYGETPAFKGETPAKAADAQYSYVFDGWDAEPAPVYGNVTYTAQFKSVINQYAITWVVDGTANTVMVDYGTVPTFAGSTDKAATAEFTYTFAGWDNEPVAVTGDATYTATYTETKNKYTVTWIVDGQTTTAEVEYGTVPAFTGSTDKAATAEFTYTFAGWDNEPVAVTGDATYTATYTETKNKYTVTWIVDGQTTTAEVEYGTVPTFAGSTDKAATAEFTYTFAGWDNEPVAVTGDATYTATYTETKNKYTITWIVDGQTTTAQVEYGTVPTFAGSTDKAATAEFTYTFAGWDNEPVAVTGDATYTATYTETKNKYTVTWVVDGNSTTAEVEYGVIPTYDGIPTKPTDPQYIYTFAGWTPTVEAVTGDVTYTAIFDTTPNTVSITFKVEGQADVTIVVQIGQTPVYPNGTPAKASDAQYTYTFAGWDKEIATATESTVYTAKFDSTVNKYTITWIVGDQTTTEQVEYGKVPSFSGSTNRPSDAQYNYTFKGWDATPVAVTGDATYTAQFDATVRKYTVMFKYGHNTVLPVIVEYGKAATAPTNTDKAPTAQYTYTFDGWDVDFSNITGNLTVTAKYTEAVRTYTVTFKYGDDKTETVTVEYGKAATAPTDTEKTATETVTYTFKDWDVDFSEITADITVTAIYEETPIVVINTEALQAAIDAYKAKGLDENAEVLTKAVAALTDDSLTQEEIDALTAALLAAIEAAEEETETDTDTTQPEDPTEDPEDPTEPPSEEETTAAPAPDTDTDTDTAPVEEEGCMKSWVWLVLVNVVVGSIAAAVFILIRRNFGSDSDPEPDPEEPKEETPAEDVGDEIVEEAPLFVPIGEEIPEEEIIPEEIETLDEVSADTVDELMTDKLAEALLEETEEMGGTGKLGVINIGVISPAYEAGDVVTLASLQEKGLVDANIGRLKILASGTLDKPLTFKAEAYSFQAIKMITLTGGHAIHLKTEK